MNQTQEAMTRSLARSCLYRFFSEFFLYPKEGAFSKNFEEAFQASGALGQPAGLQETLAKAAGCPREITDLRSDYALVFGYTIGKACPPYETEWGTTHIFNQTQELADISGFYRAWGLGISDQAHARLDHLSVELEFMSYVALKEAYALDGGQEENLDVCRQVQAKFLSEHLGTWVPAFMCRLESLAVESSFYRFLAQALSKFLAWEVEQMGLDVVPLKSAEPSRPGCGVESPAGGCKEDCGGLKNISEEGGA